MKIIINAQNLGLNNSNVWQEESKERIESEILNILTDYNVTGVIIWDNESDGIIGFKNNETVESQPQIEILELIQKIVVNKEHIVPAPSLWQTPDYEYLVHDENNVKLENVKKGEAIYLRGHDAKVFLAKIGNNGVYSSTEKANQLVAQLMIKEYFKIAKEWK